MSSPETGELQLQTLPCRAQGAHCHSVSGNRCCKQGSSERGAATRVPCRLPAWTRCAMPEEMVMMARRFVLRHWEVRKEEAGGGRLVRVEVPGMRRMSNWGALVKEFCEWK